MSIYAKRFHLLDILLPGARDDVELAAWIVQVNRWKKISRKVVKSCSHFDIVIKWIWTENLL